MRVSIPDQGSIRWPHFTAASASDAQRIFAKGVHPGELVFVDFRKPRNPGFHRLAHALGQIMVDNIEDFSHMEAHAVLKRLQIEADAGCETMMVEMRTIWRDIAKWISDNIGPAFAEVLKVGLKSIGVKSQLIPVRVPCSLSFDSMDQETFHSVMQSICKYVAKRYWPSMSPEQIEQMAEAAGTLVQ